MIILLFPKSSGDRPTQVRILLPLLILMFRSKKKRKISKFLRALFFLFPFLPVFYYSYTVSNNTYASLDAVTLNGGMGFDQSACIELSEKLDQFNKAIDSIKHKEEALSSLARLPGNLFGYNFFIKNDFEPRTLKDNKSIKTGFNVNINGQYKEIYSDGQEKVLSISGIDNFDNFEIANIEYSFFYFFKDGQDKISEGMEIYADENKRSIGLFLKLSFFSKCIIFLFFLASCYACLLLSDGIYKFVIFGRPFTKKNK